MLQPPQSLVERGISSSEALRKLLVRELWLWELGLFSTGYSQNRDRRGITVHM